MSPTKQNNSLITAKPTASSAMVSKKVKNATISTKGEDIVRQILLGTYVHDSDHAIHAACPSAIQGCYGYVVSLLPPCGGPQKVVTHELPPKSRRKM